jgi:hypothetical protein
MESGYADLIIDDGPVGRQAWRGWPTRSARRWFFVLWSILLLGVTGTLAVGGRPDPAGLGEALDGAWRFHAGDNSGWAIPELDDRSWDRVTLVSRPESHDSDVGIPGYLDGWRARGHPGLDGYGWYRRQIALPRQSDLVLLGPPSVDDGYEMFWDGHPIGGIGKLSGSPKVNTTRPLLVRLPATRGEQTASLAIRAFMQPGVDRDQQSGGLRTVPVLASSADGERLHRAQWRRTIAGYIVDAVEPAAMLLLAMFAAFSAPAQSRPSFARWMAVALIATACLRLGNALSAWTDLLSLPTLLWQNDVILAPMAKLAWTITWNQWTQDRHRRSISAVAVAAWLMMVVGALSHGHLLAEMGRVLVALSLLAIAIRIGRHGDHRVFALGAMLLTTIGLFASDLSALGVPSIWFPFNIGVSRSQFAYALALPLLTCALTAARTYRHLADQ